VLAATKTDMTDRKISIEAGKTFAAEQQGIAHFETSAKDNIGIDEIFIEACR
jgi:ethanolamine utilization protein EutP (predicted NTPase)